MISPAEHMGPPDRFVARAGATFAVAALCGIAELAVMVLHDGLVIATLPGLIVAFASAGALHALVFGPIALLTAWICRLFGIRLEPTAAAVGIVVTVWIGISWHVALLPGDPWYAPRGLIGTLVALALGATVALVLRPVSRRVVVAGLGVLVTLLAIADLSRDTTGPLDNPQPSSARTGWYFLIVSDTLGARHMSAYDYPRETTPFVERFSSDAVVFERAIAPSSWTRPSVVSLMTSTPVRSHQMDGGTGLLRAGITTIGERFQEKDHVTAAFVTNPFVSSRFGFEQGFAYFDDLLAHKSVSSMGLSPVWLRWGPLRHFQTHNRFLSYARRRRGAELNRRFFEWFDRTEAPGGFVWLHYMDAHNPYYAPPGSPGFGSSPADRYDASIRYWDGVFEDLVGFLEERGIWDEATVVLTSDHGEEMWEHGRKGHGLTLYDEVIHVPLIIKTPQAQSGRITQDVSLVDVAPTLIDLAGLESLPVGHQRTLGPYLSGLDMEGGPVVSEILRAHDRLQVAVIDHPWKLILRPDSGEVELYDLDIDPGEQNPVATPDPHIVRYLLDSTQTWPVDIPSLRPPSPDGDTPRPRADPKDALRALGYLSPG